MKCKRMEAKKNGSRPPTKLPVDFLALPGTWADVLKVLAKLKRDLVLMKAMGIG